MPLTIEGVPESIPLSAVRDFARSLGVDPMQVRRIEVGLGTVQLEVFATGPDGKAFADEHGPAVHRLTLRIDPHA